MAIVQTACDVFKTNLLKGLENFNTGTSYTYKIALYTADASLDVNTLVYTTDNEVTGTGYTAGGTVITPVAPATDSNTAYISFSDASWASATFTARGALIYNSTTNAAVAVLNFGSDKTCSDQTFTVTFPTFSASSAIIRIN